MSEPERAIDWEQVREKLQASSRALVEALHLPADQARALMSQRAAALAKVAQAAQRDELLETVVFEVDKVHYALESRFVSEISPLVDLAPVPGAPAFVQGVTHLRGEIVALFDLRAIFESVANGVRNRRYLLVLGRERMEFGLLADEVRDVTKVPVQSLMDPRVSLHQSVQLYTRGITAAGLIYLDGDKLLADERLIVDQRLRSDPGADGAP